MVFTAWTNIVSTTWISIWDRFVTFLPNLIGAIIILIVGWIVGMLIALVIDRIFRIAGLQVLFEKAKVEDVLAKASVEKDTTALLASVAKWIVYLVAFIAAANTLKLPSVADFLDQILAYIPSVIAAAAILVLGWVLANFLSTVVKGSMKAAGLHAIESVGMIVQYSIVIFSVLAALGQLGIAEGLIQTLFVGIVALIAIAGGLAFGLGGQKAASDWIEKTKKELE